MRRASQSTLPLFMTLIMTCLCPVPIAAQITAFTYQGKLTDAGNPANGTYEMEFKLFDTLTVGTGTQQGTTITKPTVEVTGGIFNVTLDFGANDFTGAPRYLEIGVRPAGSPDPHTILAPRQQITSSPYAIQAVNTQQLSGLPANRYVATDGNGNVGIGTSSPATKLEVVHPISQLRFGPTAADNGGYLVSTNPSQAIIAGGAKWDGANWIARDTAASLTAHQFGAIQFSTNSNLTVGSPFSPTPRMTITTDGNVGIGTPSAAPGYKVDINTAGGGVRAFFNDSTHFVAETTGGTNSWAKFIMKTPNQSWSIGTSRAFNSDQFYILDETSARIVMAIYRNGDVGIGTTNPTARLHAIGGTFGTAVVGEGDLIGVEGRGTNGPGVVGRTQNANSNAGVFHGNVHVTGTVTQGSDARLKQNISRLGYGLAEVLRLRPVTWRWKEHPERGPQLGLVAQEVEPVLPELVSTAKDAEQTKGLNYTGLLPVLVNAIKEQQAQIEQQSRQLKTQQSQIERQQREIDELRQAVKALKPSLRNHHRK